MTSTTMHVRVQAMTIVWTVLFGAVAVAWWVQWPGTLAQPNAAGTSSTRMPDGREWTTTNLNVNTDSSYCYADDVANCTRYGRLYTWLAAQRVCQTLGDGWRLPTNDDWAQMVKHFGGVRDDSVDGGKAAFVALIARGSSGFNVVYGGGRDGKGEYARVEAHGFYWTATESGPSTAWLYNLGRNGQIVNRHSDGEKSSAFAVRCVNGVRPLNRECQGIRGRSWLANAHT